MHFHSCLVLLAYLLLLLSLTLPAQAAEQFEQRISGFATLGIVNNDNPALAFRRDLTQNSGSYDNHLEWRTDSLLGLQWRGRWSHQFDTTVQVVARDRFENNLKNSVEWAFVHYRPRDGWDVRLGRMASDIFMLSEYRQVGYAYQWVRPPHDYYGLLTLYHFDGIDLTRRIDLSDGTLNIKLFYGNSDENYPTAYRSPRKVGLDFDPLGITVNLEWNHWQWRYTYVNVHINSNHGALLGDALRSAAPLWPEADYLAQGMYTRGKSFTVNEAGFGYDDNIWWAKAEVTQLDSEAIIIPDSRHFYLSIGRRFGEFSVFGLRGYARPDKPAPIITAPAGYLPALDQQLATLAYTTTLSLSGVRIQQDSIGAGVRWDVAPKMALKLQAERFHIDANGTNLWLQATANAITKNRDATIISLALDVLF